MKVALRSLERLEKRIVAFHGEPISHGLHPGYPDSPPCPWCGLLEKARYTLGRYR